MSVRLLSAWFWLLHWAPFWLLRVNGAVLGELLFLLMKRRRRIGLRNLQLCFPDWSEAERCRILRRHFREMASAFLGYGILIHGSAKRICRLVQVEDEANLDAAIRQGPVVLLLPHFLGLDFAGSRYAIHHKGSSMYSEQRMGAFDQLLYRTRSRFNQPVLIKRSAGIRPCVRALKNGYHFVYLPDQDLGPRESIFAPFFGIPVATIPAVTRIAKMAEARIVPMEIEMHACGFTLRYLPAWDNFPSDDMLADTTRMNAFIEATIRKMPSQYYWLHRRFKTRPEGEASLY